MTGNFASPGQPPIIKSDKPAKPFGAPESDADDDSEDDSDDGDDEEGGGSGGADAEKEKDKDETASTHESTPAAGDDEKKGKFKRGESLRFSWVGTHSDQISSCRRRWGGWRNHHCPSTGAHVLSRQDPQRGQHGAGWLA